MPSRQTLEATVKRAEHVVGAEEAGARGHPVEDVSDALLKFEKYVTSASKTSLRGLALTSAGEGKPRKMRSTVAESRSTSRVSFARKLVSTPSIAVTVPSKGAEEVV